VLVTDQRWLVSAVIGPCSEDEADAFLSRLLRHNDAHRLRAAWGWEAFDEVAPYTEPAEDVNDSLKSLSVKVEQIKQ
jgi:hypothetical protein